MKSQIAQTSKGSIEYTLLGSGPVVLVCHGTSSNCFSTELASPLVKAGLSVLTPSRPGYGRTLLEVGRSAEQAAEALIALLDCLQIHTCSVVAISGGGPTGIALAAGFPQRVERLILAAAVSRPEARPNEPNYENQSLLPTTVLPSRSSKRWNPHCRKGAAQSDIPAHSGDPQ